MCVDLLGFHSTGLHPKEAKPSCFGVFHVSVLQADGLSVGVPPSLYDVSPQAQQLVQLVAAVQAETFTYAR